MPDHLDAVEQQREHIMEGFRAYARAFDELGRLFANSLGLHSTDAHALIEITTAQAHGEPLTQSRLSQRIGLTTGATSSLLNRLEKHGHIVRSRVHGDRRIVTLVASPEIHQAADDFFAPLGIELDTMAAAYPPEALDQIERFVTDLHTAMQHHIADRAGSVGESVGKSVQKST